MQLYKRGNAWLTAEQLIEYNKGLGSVLSEEKIKEDEVLVAEEIKSGSERTTGLYKRC